MKSHYCHEEKAIIEFTGQCNWCGEKEMNNEPVAWTDGKGNYFDKNSFFPVDDLIPLYTHPAKTLTGAVGSLSDEEIIKLMIPRMKQILEILFNEGWLDEYR